MFRKKRWKYEHKVILIGKEIQIMGPLLKILSSREEVLAIKTAFSGRSALEIAAEYQPTLAFIALELTDIDAIELGVALTRSLKDITYALMSSMKPDEVPVDILRKAMLAGCRGALFLPFSEDKLYSLFNPL